jgi:hypothetical protein
MCRYFESFDSVAGCSSPLILLLLYLKPFKEKIDVYNQTLTWIAGDFAVGDRPWLLRS